MCVCTNIHIGVPVSLYVPLHQVRNHHGIMHKCELLYDYQTDSSTCQHP